MDSDQIDSVLGNSDAPEMKHILNWDEIFPRPGFVLIEWKNTEFPIGKIMRIGGGKHYLVHGENPSIEKGDKVLVHARAFDRIAIENDFDIVSEKDIIALLEKKGNKK